MIAIGGYAEFVGGYLAEEGVSEGWSFEARRFNIFIFSSIADLIRLTAELEFEHGTEEIALETALVDVRFHRAFTLRAGILLAPIGQFNITHDSPRYEIIERPLVSTQIIPSTYSDVGIGFTGSFYPMPNHKLNYEVYAINGLGAGIITGDSAGTRVAKGKSLEIFEEDNNGIPAVTGRIGYTSPIGLSFGVSMYAGIYNNFQAEGEVVSDKRWLMLFALDFEYTLGPITLRGETAITKLDIKPGWKSCTQIHNGHLHRPYLEDLDRAPRAILYSILFASSTS